MTGHRPFRKMLRMIATTTGQRRDIVRDAFSRNKDKENGRNRKEDGTIGVRVAVTPSLSIEIAPAKTLRFRA
jgi:hypothetical protein